MRIKALLILIFAYAMAFCLPRPEGLEVSFITLYPGSEIYELEGHSAIRLKAPNGMDMAVNYGTFDFNQPNFVYRFVKGETDYWVTVYPWQPFALSYMAQGRSIVEHPIRMDSVQLDKLWTLLNTNLLPENTTYRYNYVKDNCATRPLRLIELALADTIILPEPVGDAGSAGNTFREVMRHYHKNYPWYQFGIDLALGKGIDYTINAREKAFAPIVLEAQLSQLANVDPRIGERMVYFEGSDAVLAPTSWLLTPMAVNLAVLAIVVLISIHDVRKLSMTRWLDAILYAIFGIAGCILTFLIFVSVHEATSPNYLYLWLNPLCLIIPIFIWLKKCKFVVLSYQFANFALILVMALIWPFCGQSGNWAFVPLILADALRSITYIYVYYKQRNIKSKTVKVTGK